MCSKNLLECVRVLFHPSQQPPPPQKKYRCFHSSQRTVNVFKFYISALSLLLSPILYSLSFSASPSLSLSLSHHHPHSATSLTHSLPHSQIAHKHTQSHMSLFELQVSSDRREERTNGREEKKLHVELVLGELVELGHLKRHLK